MEEAGRMGQICWKRMGEIWEVRHIQDQGLTVSQLKSLRTLDQLEELGEALLDFGNVAELDHWLKSRVTE
jgi:hypothetical protein